MFDVNDVFNKMKLRLTSEKASKINAIYLFDIGGVNGEKWSVDLTKKSDWVIEGEGSVKAQCTIIIDKSDDLISLASGKINPTMAFMQGKIKVKGNVSLAMKLQALFF